MIIASQNKYLYTLNNANRMAESTDRAFLTAEEVVGLLDSDEEDEYLRSAGLKDIISPGSDDELGFEEEELDSGSDSEGEAEQETEL